MNYNYTSILEAAQEELSKKFVTNIKQLDAELVQKRLSCLIRCNKSDASILDIMGQFNSLMGHETSAD